jgi:lysophospholipase L1-like esterase
MSRLCLLPALFLSAAAAPPERGDVSAIQLGTEKPHATMTAYPSAEPADPRAYLRALLDEMEKAWPKNRTINVVAHGHSVPAGYFRTPDVRTFESYPHLLHVWLKERQPHAVINMIVTAIGGENSAAGAARFERDVLSHSPDLILIDYALNDRRLGLPAAREAWLSMIRQAQARKIPVVLLTGTADDRTDLLDPNAPLCQQAAQIRALAAETGAGLADSLALYQRHVKAGRDIRDLLSQTNHPNRQGHELVVETLLPFFAR